MVVAASAATPATRPARTGRNGSGDSPRSRGGTGGGHGSIVLGAGDGDAQAARPVGRMAVPLIGADQKRTGPVEGCLRPLSDPAGAPHVFKEPDPRYRVGPAVLPGGIQGNEFPPVRHPADQGVNALVHHSPLPTAPFRPRAAAS